MKKSEFLFEKQLMALTTQKTKRNKDLIEHFYFFLVLRFLEREYVQKRQYIFF